MNTDCLRIVYENNHVPDVGKYKHVIVEDALNDVLYFYDSCGAYIQMPLHIAVTNASSPPADPIEGQLYYDTVSHQLFFWNGTAWTVIESGGDAVLSVNGQGGVVVLDQDDIPDGTTFKQYSQTEKTKLAGIEAGADVTDTANVNAAGALMESEVDANIKTLVLPASTTISAFGRTLVDDASNTAARATLGLVIGTDVQAFDADLLTIASLTPSDDDILQRKAGAWAARTPAQLKTDLALTKADVGLPNVDNTSDVNKPVSTAQAAAIAVVQSDINAHEANTSNPHAVTKAQVGLGNVSDDAQLKIASNLSDLANAATARTNLGLGAADDVTHHNLILAGSSGEMTLSADPDGGEYNLGVNASGTLALYGGGGNFLNLKLLDGDVEVGDTTRGLILTAPNGTRYRVQVTNAGALTQTAI